MLETPEERVLLLKVGITGKQIEELYISCNNFKVTGNHAYTGGLKCDQALIADWQETTAESRL
ncbi:Uncharacterised protein [uncultured archaeon]|nr:Uncharacterised protein [uncultured archaeon]